MTARAVFLDRDGVLNHTVVEGDGVRSPRSREEFALVVGVRGQVARLKKAGFVTVVVTNQPDVARGRLSRVDADWFAEVLLWDVEVDSVLECRHDNSDRCSCRKPLPGLLFEASDLLDIDLGSSWLIGDRWVDLVAADRAGVRAVLVEREWSFAPSSSGTPPLEVPRAGEVADLEQAVDLVLASEAR